MGLADREAVGIVCAQWQRRPTPRRKEEDVQSSMKLGAEASGRANSEGQVSELSDNLEKKARMLTERIQRGTGKIRRERSQFETTKGLSNQD